MQAMPYFLADFEWLQYGEPEITKVISSSRPKAVGVIKSIVTCPAEDAELTCTAGSENSKGVEVSLSFEKIFTFGAGSQLSVSLCLAVSSLPQMLLKSWDEAYPSLLSQSNLP